MAKHIDLNDPEIMTATEAALYWGKAPDYVRQMFRSNPSKFPAGSIRLFGRQLLVTCEGMEAITSTGNNKATHAPLLTSSQIKQIIAELEAAIVNAPNPIELNEIASFKKLPKGQRLVIGKRLKKRSLTKESKIKHVSLSSENHNFYTKK